MYVSSVKALSKVQRINEIIFSYCSIAGFKLAVIHGIGWKMGNQAIHGIFFKI